MISHQVYFDTLGSMKEDSASWRSVFAGLSVLRLVDSYTETGASIDPANWAQLHCVRSAIEDVSDGDPVRSMLTTVLEEATKRATIDEVVCAALLAYGRALDYEASWALATDVFSTVARIARPAVADDYVPYRLTSPRPGTLDSMTLRAWRRVPPAGDEVEI